MKSDDFIAAFYFIRSGKRGKIMKTFALYLKHNSIEILLPFCIVIVCLVNEYGLVTYFERTPYIMIILVYSQIYKFSKLR